MRHVALLLLIVVTLHGCAGAMGAARVGFMGARGVALRGGATLGGAAARGGLLSRGLATATRGAGSAALRVDRLGRVFHAGEHVAILEPNGVILQAGSRRLLGEIAGGRLLEVTSSGERIAIGRVYSVIRPGSTLHATPACAPGGTLLRRELLAEVVQMQESWYHVRLLPGGTTGWVWAPLAGAALVALDQEDHQPAASGDRVRVLLDTGEVVQGRLSTRDDLLMTLDLADGSVAACDPSRVVWIERVDRDIGWVYEGEPVQLIDGRTLMATNKEQSDGVVRVTLPGGDIAFVDPDLLALEANHVPSATDQQKEVETVASKPVPDGESAYHTALEDLGHNRVDEAIAGFGQAINAGFQPAAASFETGRAYARKGDDEQALTWLHKAAALGFDVSSSLDHPDFRALERDRRLRALRHTTRAGLVDREPWREQDRLDESTTNRQAPPIECVCPHVRRHPH